MKQQKIDPSEYDYLLMVVISILSLIAGLIFLGDKVLKYLAGGG